MRILSLFVAGLLAVSWSGCDSNRSKKNQDAGVPDADVIDVPDGDDIQDIVEDIVDIEDVVDGGTGGCEDVVCNTDCVVYADGSATGDGTGTTPANAFTRIDWAIEKASVLAGECCRCEVRVARGTYHVYRNFPTDTIRLRPRVDISGSWPAGFSGIPDPEVTPSILSGEMQHFPELRVHHVVTGASDVHLSGFVIEGGFANSDEHVANPDNYGGGMINMGVTMTISNTIFRGNEARFGAGMYNRNSTITCHRCRFEDNLAEEEGGGIYNSRSQLVLSSGRILGNRAEHGGGLAIYDGSTAELVSVMFAANQAYGNGGAIANRQSSLTLINATIGYNASFAGGGIHHAGAMELNVHNSIVWANTPDPIRNLSGNTPLVTYSNVSGGCTVAGGCTTDETGNLDVDPAFWAPVQRDLRLWFTSPMLDMGNNALMTESYPADVEGHVRFADGNGDGTATIDIGAHEGRDESGMAEILPILYVDTRATGAGDGSSWDDAYPELWMALNSGKSAIFHVARGVYVPNSYAEKHIPFFSDRGIVVLGGFAPDLGVSDLSVRDPEVYESVLSADLLFNDSLGHYNDNSDLVLSSTGNLILDGLVLQGARQAGIDVNGGNFSLKNSVVRNNHTQMPAVRASHARVVIENTTFEHNATTINFGSSVLYISDSTRDSRITNSRFIANTPLMSSTVKINQAKVDITGSDFISNEGITNLGGGISIGHGGGAIAVVNNSGFTTNISDCTFTGNRSGFGGAIMLYNSVQVNLKDNVFTDNVAYNPRVLGRESWNCTAGSHDFAGSGGAVAIHTSTVSIRGATFTGNSASTGEVTICDHTLRHFTGNGGAVFSDNSLVKIHAATFENNIATGGRCFGGNGGGLAGFNYSRIHISNSVFMNNHSRRLGGAHAINNFCHMAKGGAVFLHHTGVPGSLPVSHGTTPETASWIANTVIWGNTATPNLDPNNGHWYGAGGISLAGAGGGRLWVVNSTVTNNTGGNGSYGGAGILFETTMLMVNNSIVHSNIARSNTFGYRDVSGPGGFCQGSSVLHLHSSNVGSPSSCPSGCTCNSWYSGNPAFVNSGANPPDLRLNAGSVCRNAGRTSNLIADTNDMDDDGNITELIPLDLDGQPRVQGTEVDCGAYERD